jgi:hypothetical protein
MERATWLMLLAAACEPEAAPVLGSLERESPRDGDVTRAQVRGIDVPAHVAAWVAETRVGEGALARRRLFSWTTADTVARLRKDRALFDDNQLPTGPTFYVQRLEYAASLDDEGGRLARMLLGHPDLRRRRYAWSRPWPTRLGLGERAYGDQLIEVVLAPQALVGVFDPSAARPWRFVDLDQRDVPLARALAEPWRIGAILHVQHADEPRYREYVLCNESMIASWSLATPAIAQVLAHDAAQLRALAAVAGMEGTDLRDALAFEVERYLPGRARYEELAAALEASAQEGEALVVRPERKFDLGASPELVAVRRIPPRIFLPV